MVDGELVRLVGGLAEYYVRVEGRGYESAVMSGARDLLGVVESDFGDVRFRAVEVLKGLVGE